MIGSPHEKDIIKLKWYQWHKWKNNIEKKCLASLGYTVVDKNGNNHRIKNFFRVVLALIALLVSVIGLINTSLEDLESNIWLYAFIAFIYLGNILKAHMNFSEESSKYKKKNNGNKPKKWPPARRLSFIMLIIEGLCLYNIISIDYMLQELNKKLEKAGYEPLKEYLVPITMACTTKYLDVISRSMFYRTHLKKSSIFLPLIFNTNYVIINNATKSKGRILKYEKNFSFIAHYYHDISFNRLRARNRNARRARL